MIERQVDPRRRSLARVLVLLTACCLTLGVAASITSAAVHKKARPKSIASKVVMRCLRKAHLRDVTANGDIMWLGYDLKVGGFVYVQRYPTLKSARTEAKFLSDEESGLASTLVISQHIAPYTGSPVPKITKCLGGKMVSKPPKKQTGTYGF